MYVVVVMLLSILLILLYFQSSYCQQGNNYGYGFYGLYNAVVDIASYTYEKTISTIPCPYVENMMLSLQQSLPRYIKSQDEAINMIEEAIASWEFDKQSGSNHPLVLSFTGPTGVGKTETAYRIAESILAKKTRQTSGTRYQLCGLLTLRGEDYSNTTSTTSVQPNHERKKKWSDGKAAAVKMDMLEGEEQEMHRRIKAKLASHLEKCKETGIIIFDEIQKAAPKVLEVLIPALSERGSISVDPWTRDKSSDDKQEYKQYSTSNCIFIFISDIGSEKMIDLLLKYGEKSLVPRQSLREAVKGALNEKLSANLQFGKYIKDIIPFLPLEPNDLTSILKLKLMEEAELHRHFIWLDLIVDDNVIELLVGNKFIQYKTYTTTVRIKNEKQEEVDVNGNINSKGKKNNNSTIVTRTKVFAEWGARSLENAGPLKDLKSCFMRLMQPWRPLQVLHIGLLDSTTRELQAKAWGNAAVKSGESLELYFQWCVLTPTQAALSKNKTLVIDAQMAFSDQCETKALRSPNKLRTL